MRIKSFIFLLGFNLNLFICALFGIEICIFERFEIAGAFLFCLVILYSFIIFIEDFVAQLDEKNFPQSDRKIKSWIIQVISMVFCITLFYLLLLAAKSENFYPGSVSDFLAKHLCPYHLCFS